MHPQLMIHQRVLRDEEYQFRPLEILRTYASECFAKQCFPAKHSFSYSDGIEADISMLLL
ncbi:MAG: hypothetical protein JWN25_2099 [Verrucomicrobiales bacterium]|nr:hypothetical protein [Verrucomicrobiales bacterium]